MKPDVVADCLIAGATLSYVDYDELEEDSPLKAITTLPTFQIRSGTEWKSFSANDYSSWKDFLMSQAVTSLHTNDF
jgi:hypothetical protein